MCGSSNSLASPNVRGRHFLSSCGKPHPRARRVQLVEQTRTHEQQQRHGETRQALKNRCHPFRTQSSDITRPKPLIRTLVEQVRWKGDAPPKSVHPSVPREKKPAPPWDTYAALPTYRRFFVEPQSTTHNERLFSDSTANFFALVRDPLCLFRAYKIHRRRRREGI